jgi:hypothetical protein
MKKISPVILVVSLILFSFTAARAEDGWLTTTLRIDLTDVRLARDYITFLDIQQYPQDQSMLTTRQNSRGYLKMYPGSFTSQYMEVGIRIRKLNDPVIAARAWYVDAPLHSVQCLRGTQVNSSFCSGAGNDSLTTTDAEYRFELVTYGNNFWIARVQNMSTLAIADVAKITSSAVSVNGVFNSLWIDEQGDPAPNETIVLLRNPSYMLWGSGFQLWPLSSGGNNNTFAAVSLAGCPTYYKGATVGTRSWLAGNLAAGACSLNPFF